MTFKFGKYRGRDIEEIRFKDPRYVFWAIENVSGFAEIAEKAQNEARKPSRSGSKRNAELIPPKPTKRPPAREWSDNRPNPILEAILADPILAYCHPLHMHMGGFSPDSFALGDAPPY